jgi:hypothetical protein
MAGRWPIDEGPGTVGAALVVMATTRRGTGRGPRRWLAAAATAAIGAGLLAVMPPAAATGNDPAGTTTVRLRPVPVGTEGAATVSGTSYLPWSVWAYATSTNESNATDSARVGRSPSTGAVYRTFWRFPASTLAGTTVVGAQFSARLVHSWSCGPTPVNLYAAAPFATHGKVSWSTPLVSPSLSERSVNANKDAACGVQPDMWVTFGDALTGHVRDAASVGSQWIYLALSTRRPDGSGESTQTYWKKFDPASVVLTVTVA